MPVNQIKKIKKVENGLQPPKQLPELKPKNVITRMNELRIPKASVTMIVDGEIAWSRDYDSISKIASNQSENGHAPVFQAGSISKTVNAVLAMKLLVEAGKMGVDDDLTGKLANMGIHNNTGIPITLSQLLSHTAGTSVHGFPGYHTKSSYIPTTSQIIEGNSTLGEQGPSDSKGDSPNTAPIEIVRNPGVECVYSGGGTTIVQRLIEMAYPGKTYTELAKEHIFTPLEMTQSTFELQHPQKSVKNIQKAHDHKRKVIDGGWRVHPESAAAGLWTTTGDLAKFAIAIHQMSLGTMQNPILQSETVQKMLLRQPNSNFGLGFEISGDADALSFGHGGVTEGFCADYIFFPKTGMGAVILTNAVYGGGLIGDLYCSIAKHYDWPRRGSITLNPVLLTDKTLQRCVGEFTTNDGMTFISTVVDGKLQLSLPGFHHKKRADLTFVPLSETKFFCVEYQFEVTFGPDYNAMTFSDGLHSKRIENNNTKKDSLSVQAIATIGFIAKNTASIQEGVNLAQKCDDEQVQLTKN